jgi:hypothetical protein
MCSASATTEPPVIPATGAYEDWLRERTDVIEVDLQYKHQQMKASLFAFLRGTFYRWASLWPVACPDLAKAPQVLAVGDLHVENFGTWRDLEGRLIWGVNDFDEVATMPYGVDLVRTVTSAMFAKQEKGLTIDDDAAAAAVCYSQSLEAGGSPFVFEEGHPALRAIATSAERDPVPFWSKLTKLPSATPPKRIRRLLTDWLPDDAQDIVFSARIAGVGSLGRRATWRSALATVAWRRAKRRHGCPLPGAGQAAGLRTTPTRRGSSNGRCGRTIPTTRCARNG